MQIHKNIPLKNPGMTHEFLPRHQHQRLPQNPCLLFTAHSESLTASARQNQNPSWKLKQTIPNLLTLGKLSTCMLQDTGGLDMTDLPESKWLQLLLLQLTQAWGLAYAN